MPRTARVIVPGVPHHIIIRGNNRRRLFSYPGDYLYYMRLLSEGVTTLPVDLNAHNLLGNHGHFIATPWTKESLSDLMKSTNQRYAQRRNTARQGSGKLFDERFYSKVLETDDAVAMAQLYVELNHVKHGLRKEASGYRWSSFDARAGLGSRRSELNDVLTPLPFYVALGRADEERRARYAELAMDRLERGFPPEPERDHFEAPTAEPTARVQRPGGKSAR